MSVNRNLEQVELTRFFAIAFIFSWAIWGIAVVITNFTDIDLPWLITAIILLGAFGPFVSSIWLTYKDGGKKAAITFLKRGLQVKTVPVSGWLAMFLVPSISWAGALFFVSLNQEVGFDFQLLLVYPVYVVAMILGGPLQEEYGWRGYALDRMQQRWNWLIASCILGLAWATWHLPLFFIIGSPQQNLPVSAFFLSVLGLSILMTWLYNNSKRSIFVALIFHAIVNSIGDLFNLGGDGGGAGYPHYAVIQIAIVLFVVAIWRPVTVERRSTT